MLDKYIGDAVMAVWGAPLPQPDHARRACAAALEMLGRLHRVNEHAQARGWPHIKIGVGLNTGPMVFGNMGSVHHLSLTVMGDNVNLGSRLEGLTKMYGASIIASEWTVAEAGNVVVAREIDLVRVKGKAQAVRIFELLGRESEREQWTWLIERSNAGIEAYRQQRFTEGLAIFGAILKERPEDGLARLYAERCRTLMEAPPPPEWDGVTVMETK
jgi:adenylate cyclase